MEATPDSLYIETEHFQTKGIQTLFNPHPYTIGPKHIAYTSDHCGGILSEKTIPDAEKFGRAICEECRVLHIKKNKKILSYHEHITEKALIIEVDDNSNINNIPGLHDYLKKIVEESKKFGITGFGFPQRKKH